MAVRTVHQKTEQPGVKAKYRDDHNFATVAGMKNA
jgi:hypothetical protein